MSYLVYFDKMVFPITPSKIEMKINNKNKTIDLVNLGECNITKIPGLTEITFDALFPFYRLPIVNGDLRRVEEYLDDLERFKTNRAPFPFIVSRSTPRTVMFSTNINVTLEEYTIKDDVEEGPFIKVSFKLKQYKSFSTKKIVITTPPVGPPAGSTETPRPSPPPPKTHTVKKGDSLWAICKTHLGDGSKKTYDGVYQLNKELMDRYNKKYNTSKYTIYPGQVLRLE
ncbi:MAG: LysM peptidoglycan-binding domain-containing protein [Paraclostridium sp.]